MCARLAGDSLIPLSAHFLCSMILPSLTHGGLSTEIDTATDRRAIYSMVDPAASGVS